MLGVRHKGDFYPTPHTVIEALLRHLTLEDTVWEPCAGDGRLVVALRGAGATVISHDIATGHDIFEAKAAPATMVVTNPPFRFIRQFIDHAFGIGVERMALICPERLWACKKGHDQWGRHRPSLWANLDWREDYLQKGGSPDRALAAAMWDTPHSPECRYEVWAKRGFDEPTL